MTVVFQIWRRGNMCRISTNNMRYRKIANGGCVTSISVLLDEMTYITEECQKKDDHAVFEIMEGGI